MQLRTVDRFAPPRSAANFSDHLRAMASPVTIEEQGLVHIAKGITCLAQGLWNITDDGLDYVLGDSLGDMLNGFIGMLNGVTGRLDPGSLDSWARYTAAAVGYCLDHECMGSECADGINALRDREGLPQSWSRP